MITQGILDALQQALALFQRFVALFLLSLVLERSELQIAARGILELLALVLIQLTHDPLIDALGEQQHLDATLLELLDVGTRASGGEALGDEEVDALLARLHALDVLREARRRLVPGLVRAGEAQQRQDAIL